MDKYIDLFKVGLSAAVGYLLGGWDGMLQLLVAFVVFDYVTGLIVAAVFRNSPKTENGAIETRAGFKGLMRKMCILLTVMMVTILEHTLGDTTFCRNTVIVFFVANEGLSILENFGLMGVKYPPFIKNALEVLLRQSSTQAAANVSGGVTVGAAVVQASTMTVKSEEGADNGSKT